MLVISELSLRINVNVNFFSCSFFVVITGISLLQPPLVQAVFNRNAEEVQLLLHKKEDVNALVCVQQMELGCKARSYVEAAVA